MKILIQLGIASSLLAFSIFSAQAEDKAASAITIQRSEFQLKDLLPVSISLYPADISTNIRFYIQLRNQDGNHFIVYEEDESKTATREFHELKSAVESWASTCNLDMDCMIKPFCTGSCKNMYYQVANWPMVAIPESKSKCKIKSFTCTRRHETPSSPLPEHVTGAKLNP